MHRQEPREISTTTIGLLFLNTFSLHKVSQSGILLEPCRLSPQDIRLAQASVIQFVSYSGPFNVAANLSTVEIKQLVRPPYKEIYMMISPLTTIPMDIYILSNIYIEDYLLADFTTC